MTSKPSFYAAYFFGVVCCLAILVVVVCPRNGSLKVARVRVAPMASPAPTNLRV